MEDGERIIGAVEAGIKTEIGNHIFRSTGINAYFKNKETLEGAQHIAGHESLRMTSSMVGG